MRSYGRFADYERALPRQHKEPLLHAVAATWIPLDTVVAHYAACDSLGISPEQHVKNGRSTFEGSRATILGTAVRMARGAGLTPWHMFPLWQRFWDRGFDGGGLQVTRAGPKDAHVTIVQCPLVPSPYFRNGLRGLGAGLTELVCSRAYVTERRHSDAGTLALRVQWA